ncbi:Neural cell adhesion molecule 2 [Tupaia chinensis]|uniref:Neural cell adhesion molecule 2 n=1 Tax=Tupaia chinensis TaxID=246437 RepID=L8YF79_TUPCH|nr:Neural cell adhesion molecule 2 [Tupaia chinensis]
MVQKEGVRSRLTIYNANIEDAGIYRCQATDAKGQTQEATVVLEIYQKLTFTEVVSPQEFKQGEDAEVVCRVSSSPAPAVSWLYHNEEVTAISDNRFAMLANNNLQILNISKSDEGIYRCEGRVEARGEIDFRDIIVIVNVPPAITMPQKSFNATAERGEEMTLSCRASGSPEPAITWYRNGKLIEENEKYTLKGGNTELTVRNIINSDGGPYICRATNKAGEDEKQAFLQVFVQPHIIQLKNETMYEDGQVTLICEAEGEPIPEITWKRAMDGITFSEGDKIAPTSDNDFGRYNCTATNHIGTRFQEYILALADVSCFFIRQCGLLMCITRRMCGKKSGSSGKSKELEEGKAAYLKDGSKEPIVEMRTEDERITNHEDGSPVNEPNETTPLTEPEKLPLKEENGKEVLSQETIEIKVSNDIIQSKEDDSKA